MPDLEPVFVGKLLVAVVVALDFETGFMLVVDAVVTVAAAGPPGGGNGCVVVGAPVPAKCP